MKKFDNWAKPVGLDGMVVYMSPLEFLEKVPSPCREGRPASWDLDMKNCWTENSLKAIKRRMARNLELDMPYLDYENVFRGFPTHEGRHTARVAYELGMEEIPVLVVKF